MTQFAIAGRTQTETKKEGGQHQAKGIDAITGDNRQHMHVDDFQRQADHTAYRHQQQGGESEAATLPGILWRQDGITAFFVSRICGRRGRGSGTIRRFFCRQRFQAVKRLERNYQAEHRC